MPDPVPNPGASLADVTSCVACGYLIAVPDPAGRRPECGTSFHRGTLIPFGRRRFQRWDPPLGVAFALLYAGLFTRLGRDRLSWMYGAVYGLSVLGYAATWARRAWATRPAPARLRMDRTGCGLDVEPPAVPIVAHVVTAARGLWQRHAARPIDETTDEPAAAELWVVGKWGTLVAGAVDRGPSDARRPLAGPSAAGGHRSGPPCADRPDRRRDAGASGGSAGLRRPVRDRHEMTATV